MIDTCKIPEYIASGTLAADNTGDAIDTTFYTEVIFQVLIAATSTPAGDFILQGSEDGTNWEDINIEANKVHGTIDGSDAAHTGGEEIAIAGSAASNFRVSLVDGIPSKVRTFWDSTSGGAATGLNVKVTMRGEV